jgi:hypothetical protein
LNNYFEEFKFIEKGDPKTDAKGEKGDEGKFEQQFKYTWQEIKREKRVKN